ncbi:MAG: hypothetical protein Q7S61_05900 [bacterium]|nr:hypothetical protein [bacterium]
MNYITATDLRTKTVELIATLKRGGEVSLVHRSEVVGIIQPIQNTPIAITNVKDFERFIDSIKPAKLIPEKDREKVYRRNLMKKYDEGLS